ncbi:MAG: diacylglycerol kinase family protein, partial [Nostoc sp.]
ELVIIGGGDGTLNAAVDALVDTQLPLGILPLGTANDLARTLEIPNSLSEACKIIAYRNLHRIDLGWVNGKHFFNVASLGLSVKITERLTKE